MKTISYDDYDYDRSDAEKGGSSFKSEKKDVKSKLAFVRLIFKHFCHHCFSPGILSDHLQFFSTEM